MSQLTDLQTSDASLVLQSTAGDRDAFTHLVERYQSLICAIAYNATGNLAQSEDLSQEIFVAAWRSLPSLDDPGKFRPWLCGIARNLIHNALRANRRHPTHSLDAHPENPIDPPSPAEDPAAAAISREEESLLWRSLERIPDTYREPLILFYRQQQSLEQVASALDLSQDAVKQRLSRGRKLLHENLASFVESTLKRSNPGKAFALGVALALPSLAGSSAKAATLTAGAATGTATAKSATLLALLGTLFSPLMMLFGIWSGYRLGIETAKSTAEQSFIKSFYRRLFLCITGFGLTFALLCAFGKQIQRQSPSLLATLVIAMVLTYATAIAILCLWARRMRLRLHLNSTQDSRALPTEEYRSARKFLGFPLLHMKRHGGVNDPPAIAWIALGDNTRGLLFAFGGTAIAPIAIGGRAIGIFAWGGLSIGLFSMGGFSLGLFSLGGIALGYQTFGGCSLAWNAAAGAIAIARNFADGALAVAAHANDSLSDHFFHNNWFFHAGNTFSNYSLPFNALWAIPLFLWWRTVKKNKHRQTPPT